MRRKNGDSPISLFSFQDAMTGVCGVVVLITLILALELTRRVESEASLSVSQTQLDVAREKVRELQAELDVATRNLEEQTAINANVAGTTPEEARSDLEAVDAKLQEVQEENERLNAELTRSQSEENDVQKLQEELERASSELETLEKELNAARNYSASTSSAYYKFPENVREKPWFFEISDGRIQGTTRDEQTQTFLGESCVKEFVKWAKTRERSKEYFVLVFRPSGAGLFSELTALLQLANYRYGVDLVAEDVELRFLTEESRKE